MFVYLTIFHGLIFCLARKYECFIQFGFKPNQVRDKLLHCTKIGICSLSIKGEVQRSISRVTLGFDYWVRLEVATGGSTLLAAGSHWLHLNGLREPPYFCT